MRFFLLSFVKSLWIVVVEKYAFGSAVEVFVLTVAKRPQKREKAETAERQGNGNEEEERTHVMPPSADGRARRALSVTAIELADMAAAASSGVASPRTATGMSTAL